MVAQPPVWAAEPQVGVEAQLQPVFELAPQVFGRWVLERARRPVGEAARQEEAARR